ncbi:uncharacterized [Tachysurus ichikawai]
MSHRSDLLRHHSGKLLSNNMTTKPVTAGSSTASKAEKEGFVDKKERDGAGEKERMIPITRGDKTPREITAG